MIFGKKKIELMNPYDNRVLRSNLESQKWSKFADDQNRATIHLKNLSYQAGAVLLAYRVLELGDYRYQVKGSLVFRHTIKNVKSKINKAEFVVSTISGPDIATRGITYSEMLKQSGLSDAKISEIISKEDAR